MVDFIQDGYVQVKNTSTHHPDRYQRISEYLQYLLSDTVLSNILVSLPENTRIMIDLFMIVVHPCSLNGRIGCSFVQTFRRSSIFMVCIHLHGVHPASWVFREGQNEQERRTTG